MVLTWNMVPGVTYWVMYAPTTAVVDVKNPPAVHAWLAPVTSPLVVSGLIDGTAYSFAINGRIDGGPGGPEAHVENIIPRVAGDNWTAQTALGANDIRGIAYGLASTSASTTTLNYVAVGGGGSLYYGIDAIDPITGAGGVTWTQSSTQTATRTTTPPVVDFKASLYALGKFIAVGTNDTTTATAVNAYYSTDMVNWTAATTPLPGGLNALASNGAAVLGVGDGGVVKFTVDGSTWSTVTGLPTPASGTPNLYGIVYSTYYSQWLVVGSGCTVWTGSADLTTWTPVQTNNACTSDLRGISVSPAGVAVAVGQAGVVVSNTDTTGSGWMASTVGVGTLPDLYAVTVDAMQFLTVGQNGAVYTASNPSNLVNGTGVWSGVWLNKTNATTTAAGNLYAMYGSSAKYVVGGQAGANLISQ